MNQSQWESACKSRSRYVRWAIIAFFCLVPISLAIICNNIDQPAQDANQKKNNSSDSSFFTFQYTDSLEIEKMSNGDTAYLAESRKMAQTSADQAEKVSKVTADTDSIKSAGTKSAKQSGTEKTTAKADPAVEKNAISAISRKDTIKTEKHEAAKSPVKESENGKTLKDNKLHEYSVMLPEIHYYAVDRKDIIISLALELFYKDSVSGREILSMRDALNTIALNLLKNKELALLNKDSAARELEIKMNEIFERKTLSRVMIREFNIEKATKR